MNSIRLWILNGQVRQYYLTYPNPSVRKRKNRVCQLMVFSSSLPVSRRYPSQWNLALSPEEKKRGGWHQWENHSITGFGLGKKQQQQVTQTGLNLRLPVSQFRLPPFNFRKKGQALIARPVVIAVISVAQQTQPAHRLLAAASTHLPNGS